MADLRSRIAKISPPISSGALPRRRLFRLLDDCRKKPVVWISGPAGSGKTTLVSSYLTDRNIPCLWYQVDEGDNDTASFFYYMGLAAKKAAPRYKKPLPLLTPEYIQGLPTFTRRYSEELFRRLTPHSRSPKKMDFSGAAVVFDNFQDASSEGFHLMVRYILEEVPEGINVVVLSRSEPPGQLARLMANSNMAVIGWKELSFTQKECRAFLKSRNTRRIPAYMARELHERTHGWAAGLVLMTESSRAKQIEYSLISELSLEAVLRKAERTIGMYRGDFLPAETDRSWTVSLREKIRRKILQLVTSLGQYWKDTGQCEKAVAVFERGLEIDNLTEEFYQQLMICHERLGQGAEAAKVYLRCSGALSSALGIGPSKKTETLYAGIKASR